jgi:hypothetical protein
MIQKRLFAVSPTPSVQAELTSQDAILAAFQQRQSFNIGANVRLHWYDPEAAQAWLDYARSDRFSREAINALSSEEQSARVDELWKAFGKYWRCLNVSPYGWARFRRLLESLWGYPSYAIGQDGWKGKVNTPYMNGRWGGAWRQRAHAAIYAPPQPQGVYSPAFGGNRSAWYTGRDNPQFGPTDVVFGTPSPYAIENAAGRPSEVGSLPNRSFAPTVEVHRVWMQRTGEVYGGYPNGLNRAYANGAIDMNRTLATLWQSSNFHQPPTNVPGRWDDWTVGFAIPDPGTVAQGGAAYRHRRAASTDVQWTVPPLFWYWEILRAAYPLPTGYSDTVTYPNQPTAPTPLLSILDYLARLTPDQVVREVMNDVMWRNSQMASQAGFPLDRLGDAALTAELNNRRAAAVPSLATQIISSVASVTGGVVDLATGGKAGLAGAGMVSQAVRLVDTLDNEYEAIELRRTDVFGRGMPALDTVAITDDETDARARIAEAGLPTGGGVFTGLIANIGGNADAMGTGSLSIVEMPHGGEVEVGTAREVPQCRWADAEMRTWRCTIPTGPQWVRVASPSGEARMAQTGTSSTSPATLTWPAMAAESRFAIAGLPQGSAVFVDGAPAMGTWQDAAMTTWEVLAPAGSHAIRLVPPNAAPVLAQVAFPSSATFAAMTALSAQQAVEASPSSGSGLWLALGVTAVAAGLFYATTQMDGRKSNPPRRRKQ